jgi:UDP-glucose 4-epimerase
MSRRNNFLQCLSIPELNNLGQRPVTMKRVMLTGGNGFIGANLARRLMKDGYDVHLLVRPDSTPWRLLEIRANVQLHQVSLETEDLLTKILSKVRPEWIFHLAVYGAYPSQTDFPRMVRTNIAGTMNLLQACLNTGFEVFVNSGSSSEYGHKDHAPAETELLEPNSHYAVTKASATLLCQHEAQSRRMRIPTLRLYSVYGPHEGPTRLMPTLIRKGMHGEWPPLAKPDIARDYVYIEDVLDAYLLAATQTTREFGAVFNVGTGIQTSLCEVAQVAKKVLPIPIEPSWETMPIRQWDTTTWVADNRKIRAELGWQPRHTFEQGFRLMVDWLCSLSSGGTL